MQKDDIAQGLAEVWSTCKRLFNRLEKWGMFCLLGWDTMPCTRVWPVLHLLVSALLCLLSPAVADGSAASIGSETFESIYK